MKNKLLADKTALIIGASQGIGFETAALFAEEGATVIITGRNLTTLEAAVANIPGNVKCIQSDMSCKEDREILFSKIAQEYKSIDITFINAGMAEGAPLNLVTEESFDQHIATNYKGAFFCAQHSARLMQEKASIIFTASIAGSMGIEHLSVYSSTKAALLSLTKTLAADLSAKGIRVNAISPGYIATPLGIRNNTHHYDEVCASIPLEHRFGTAREVAYAALFLASEMSSYITGENIVVDGGLSNITPTPKAKRYRDPV
ncbi:MAG: glucose 1-dehydrogenase [Gammaproteobacteria bacterium]|jgi:NAD(P)-dependent dehydrogenase (short-subunit alcohol dehydrogenase family)|nr:glucose 1-dehydrogenase [Gammaproteobacteria bacterium]